MSDIKKAWHSITFKLIAALVLLTIVYFAYSKIWSSPKNIDYTIVEKQDVLSTITSTGTVTSDSIILVKSQVPNLIKSSGYRIGDKFKLGDILIEFDNSNEIKSVEQAEASLRNEENRLQTIKSKDYPDAYEASYQAELTFNKQKDSYEKIKKLSEAGSASTEELSNAKYTLDLALSKLNSANSTKNSLSPEGVLFKDAENRIVQAKLLLESAKSNYNKTSITAPFNGLVLKKYFEAGELSSIGKELFMLAKDEEMFIKASIDEKYASKLLEEQKVIIKSQSNSNQTFNGTIARISPSVDNKTGTIDIDIKLTEQPSYLKRDMTVNIEIITERLESVIVLDKKHVGGKNGSTVWKLKGGVVSLEEITIMQDLGDRVIASDGVAAGDILLLKDSFNPGKAITLDMPNR